MNIYIYISISIAISLQIFKAPEGPDDNKKLLVLNKHQSITLTNDAQFMNAYIHHETSMS